MERRDADRFRRQRPQIAPIAVYPAQRAGDARQLGTALAAVHIHAHHGRLARRQLPFPVHRLKRLNVRDEQPFSLSGRKGHLTGPLLQVHLLLRRLKLVSAQHRPQGVTACAQMLKGKSSVCAGQGRLIIGQMYAHPRQGLPVGRPHHPFQGQARLQPAPCRGIGAEGCPLHRGDPLHLRAVRAHRSQVQARVPSLCVCALGEEDPVAFCRPTKIRKGQARDQQQQPAAVWPHQINLSLSVGLRGK